MRFFSLSELTRSDKAAQLGLANTPHPEARIALHALVEAVLDPLREHLGRPVHVSSGYRCLAVNRAVGSDDTSQHIRGEAADIWVDGMSPRELARAVVDLGLQVDQLIWYEPGHHKPAVHVSHTRRRRNRGEVLHWVLTEPHYREEVP